MGLSAKGVLERGSKGYLKEAKEVFLFWLFLCRERGCSYCTVRKKEHRYLRGRYVVNRKRYHWGSPGQLPKEPQKRADSLREGLVAKLLILVALKNNLMGWIVKYYSAFPGLAETTNTNYVCATAQLIFTSKNNS